MLTLIRNGREYKDIRLTISSMKNLYILNQLQKISWERFNKEKTGREKTNSRKANFRRNP